MKMNVFFKGIFLFLFVFGNIALTDAGTTLEDRSGVFYVKWPYPHVPEVTPADGLEITSTKTTGENISTYKNAKVLGIYEITCGNGKESIMIPNPPSYVVVTFKKDRVE